MEWTAVYMLLVAVLGFSSGVLYMMVRLKDREIKRLERTIRILKLEMKVKNPSYEPESLDDKILRLHLEGYSIRRIAREVGMSHSGVHKRLKKLLGENRPIRAREKPLGEAVT